MTNQKTPLISPSFLFFLLQTYILYVFKFFKNFSSFKNHEKGHTHSRHIFVAVES